MMTLEDIADLREAISRSDGAFSSTSEHANQEQDAKTQRLEHLMDACERTVRARMEAERHIQSLADGVQAERAE